MFTPLFQTIWKKNYLTFSVKSGLIVAGHFPDDDNLTTTTRIHFIFGFLFNFVKGYYFLNFSGITGTKKQQTEEL